MIAWLIIFRISYKLEGLIPLEVLIKSHMVVWLFVLWKMEVMGIGLSQRQKMFASEYLRTGNVYQSAILAGYSEAYARTTASKLLENASVKTFIQTETEKMHDENILSAKEALSILSDIARGKRLEEVLMMNPVTGEVDRVTKKADNNTVIKAIAEILKRYPTAKQAEKLELEIEKLKSQIGMDDEHDDKLVEFAKALRGAFNDK